MKQRIISAAVAILLACVVLALHSTIVYTLFLAVVGSLMVYEMHKANGLEKSKLLLVSSVLAVLAVPFIVKFVPSGKTTSIILAWCVYFTLAVASMLFDHKKITSGKLGIILITTTLVGVMSASLAFMQVNFGKASLAYILLALCGAWLSDTGAYFVGTFFGKHKLCPEISPKKSVEGMFGGFASNILLFMLYGYIVSLFGIKVASYGYLVLAGMGLISSILGLMGDLFASVIKRETGIKDYGNIMPGHGGAYDRFDSVVFVAPFIYVVSVLCPVFVS